MLRKNVARIAAVGALSLSLVIPSGLAFAVEKHESASHTNQKHEVVPHLDDQTNLTPSGFSSSPSVIDFDTLLENKRAAESEEAESEVVEPTPEEIRQQTITSVIDTAKSLQGVPYWYGGTTPSGFDCSGFTQYVFSQTGAYELPRTAAEQSLCGTWVSFDELAPGDLVFWGSGYGVYHTGIYVGDWSYIHADCDAGITIASMDSFTPSFAMRIL